MADPFKLLLTTQRLRLVIRAFTCSFGKPYTSLATLRMGERLIMVWNGTFKYLRH